MMRAGRHDPNGAAVTLAGDRYVHSVMTTHDALEGLRAFVEKRPAAWSHR
jgi:enoyl-CoA hydratase/carnithine racemase